MVGYRDTEQFDNDLLKIDQLINLASFEGDFDAYSWLESLEPHAHNFPHLVHFILKDLEQFEHKYWEKIPVTFIDYFRYRTEYKDFV
jgi:hypothetical protein